MKLLVNIFLISIFVLAGEFTGYCELVKTDPGGYPIKNLRVPIEHYADGRVKTQVFAEGAKAVRQDETELLKAKVELYTIDGSVDASFFAEHCMFHSSIKAVMSDSSVRLQKAGMIMTGRGFEWKSLSQEFEINRNARVAIARESETKGGSQSKEGVFSVINSERLHVDYYRKIAFFEDNVRISDPLARVTSDRLTILFEGTNQVKSATVDGNVVILRDDVYAKCDKAIYLNAQSKMIMTGDPRLRSREGDDLSGDKITFWINEDRMTCENGKIVIPEKKSSAGAGASRRSVMPVDLDEMPALGLRQGRGSG